MTDFAYRNKVDGSQEEGSLTIKSDRIGPQGRSVCYALKGYSGDKTNYLTVNGVDDDFINGHIGRGANGSPMGLLLNLKTATATSIIVLMPSGTAMVAKVPILIAKTVDVADGFEGTLDVDYQWRIPSAVSAVTSSAGISGSVQQTLTVPALSMTFSKYAVVVQPTVGKNRFTSLGAGNDCTRTRGIRYQLEAPDAPTAVVVATTVTTSFTCTVSISGKTNKKFACYADLFVFTTQAAAQMGPLPNQLPDKADQAFNGTVTLTGIHVTSYGGGASAGGGALATGTRYWVVAVVKEKTMPWDNVVSAASVPKTLIMK